MALVIHRGYASPRLNPAASEVKFVRWNQFDARRILVLVLKMRYVNLGAITMQVMKSQLWRVWCPASLNECVCVSVSVCAESCEPCGGFYSDSSRDVGSR